MNVRMRTLFLLAASAILPVACERDGQAVAPLAKPPSTQPPEPKLGGDYGPVEKEQLKNGARCWATGPARKQFGWKMTDDAFEFAEAGEPIPAEVLETLLGKDAKAKKIVGKWKIVDRSIAFSEVRDENGKAYKDVSLGVFRTPVVRTYFGQTQYVVSPK